jgi:hypothetical protein
LLDGRHRLHADQGDVHAALEARHCEEREFHARRMLGTHPAPTRGNRNPAVLAWVGHDGYQPPSALSALFPPRVAGPWPRAAQTPGAT